MTNLDRATTDEPLRDLAMASTDSFRDFHSAMSPALSETTAAVIKQVTGSMNIFTATANTSSFIADALGGATTAKAISMAMGDVTAPWRSSIAEAIGTVPDLHTRWLPPQDLGIAELVKASQPDLAGLMPDFAKAMQPITIPTMGEIPGLKDMIDDRFLAKVSLADITQVAPPVSFAAMGKIMGEIPTIANLIDPVTLPLPKLADFSFTAAFDATGWWRESITTILGDWQDRAFGGDVRAWCGLFAARIARNAITNSDKDTRDETLKQFVRTWLRLRDTSDVREGAIEALLEQEWETQDANAVIKFLRRRTRRQARLQAPIIGSTYGRHRAHVQRLDALLLTDEAGQTYDRQIPGAPSAESIVVDAAFTDRRLLAALDRLTEIERAILHEKVFQHRRTWAHAAEALGYPAQLGESTRRKIKRLGARFGPHC